ncbi:hypothetical protein KKB99_03175, partial [bacterium]|nr:hypothetical protein [bacterium]MBU1024992.1 hypothetical protein [bacterium]
MNPATSDIADSILPQVESFGSARQLLGIWQVDFDINSLTASVQPVREAFWHFKVTNYVHWQLLNIHYDSITETVSLEAKIINDNQFGVDAYDVRLIIFTDSVGHLLLNPDSWTGLWDIPGGEDINPFKAYKLATPYRKFAWNSSDKQPLE